jgi:hypothetical protein
MASAPQAEGAAQMEGWRTGVPVAKREAFRSFCSLAMIVPELARLCQPGALEEVVSLSGVDRLRCQHGREAAGNYREIASLIAVMQVRHRKRSIDIAPERCNPVIASPRFSLAVMYSSTGVQQLCTNCFCRCLRCKTAISLG